MVEGMDAVLNSPEVKGSHIPVEVDVETTKTWAG